MVQMKYKMTLFAFIKKIDEKINLQSRFNRIDIFVEALNIS